MKRKRPMRRVAMKRHGPRTKKSGGHLFYKSGRNPAYLAWLRQRPCVVCRIYRTRQYSPSVAAHIKSRGSGGADLGNAMTLCIEHHDMQGLWGWPAFEKA